MFIVISPVARSGGRGLNRIWVIKSSNFEASFTPPLNPWDVWAAFDVLSGSGFSVSLVGGITAVEGQYEGVATIAAPVVNERVGTCASTFWLLVGFCGKGSFLASPSDDKVDMGAVV